jgi:3-hydroxybutyryl-CoA dehydrogenase
MRLTRNLSRHVSSIRSLAVVGCGQMGAGIGIVAAQRAGIDVKFLDSSDKALEGCIHKLDTYFKKQVEKKQMTSEETMNLMKKFSFTVYKEDLKNVDFVIEAVNENFELKKQIFQDLEKVVEREGVIFASNTSSISLTKMASVTKRPDRFIGMHFFNPVPILNLVEIIPGLQTSPETVERTKDLAKAMQKELVFAQDVPGFIANRILMPYINEAVYALQDGVASRDDIDKGMKLGTNVPMGPLTLADFIGLDTCLAIMRVLQEGLGNQKFAPCPLLVKYVDAGWYGRKSGRGFYDYSKK